MSKYLTLIPDLEEIEKKSGAFASLLCLKDEHLSEILTDNGTLIEALRKKTWSYLKQRMEKVNAHIIP